MNELKPLTVRQLNMYIKSLFEGDLHLLNVCVEGEISNFKNHYASGHWYFTVKDNDSAIRCVMFKNSAAGVSFLPEDGMRVVLKGRVSVYEKDGQYMFYANSMSLSGEGELAKQFELIKQKLSAEGLFDESNKRPLPKFPKRIAVITSDTGAAVRDIFNVLNLRYPLCEIIMCPVLVQGVSAAESIKITLDRVDKLSDIDLIILGRGGGSAEDLAAFNDEMLARKIFESPFPVISAVGHETDFSISDFVADVRASTPSHAAEIAVPDITELKAKVTFFSEKIKSNVFSDFSLKNARYDNLRLRISTDKFSNYIDLKQQNTDFLTEKLLNTQKNILNEKSAKVLGVTSKLDALSPLKVLKRGYSVAFSGDKYIKSSKELKTGDSFDLKFFDGVAECTVNNIKSEDSL